MSDVYLPVRYGEALGQGPVIDSTTLDPAWKYPGLFDLDLNGLYAYRQPLPDRSDC